MSRRQRQFDELRSLCSAGAVARAIDLAYEHFAQFGRDDDIIDLLARAVDDADVAAGAQQRFAQLCSSQVRGCPAITPRGRDTVDSCR